MAACIRPLAFGSLLAILGATAACSALTGGESGAGGAADRGFAEPVVVFGGLDRPTALGQTATSLLWADEQGTVQTATKQGGERTTLAESLGAVADLAIDGSALFWLDGHNGRLWSLDLAAGEPTLLAIGLAAPRRLALDATYVYWIDGNGSLMQLSRWGGVPWSIAAGSSELGDVLADGQNVFFTDVAAGTVESVPVSGGGLQYLATGQLAPGSLARAGQLLYWATATTVTALDLSNPEATPTIVTETLGPPEWLYAAGGYLYWSSADAGAVQRASRAGGPATTVASGQASPGALVVDTLAVYWLDHGAGPGTGSLDMAMRQPD